MADPDPEEPKPEEASTPVNAMAKAKRHWTIVRQESNLGMRFDSWDMALKVVDQGFRGELAREVKRQVAAGQADNPWAKGLLLILAYFTSFFILQGDMLPWGPFFAVFLTWLCSTAGAKMMQRIKMPALLGNLVAGIILKNAIPDPDCDLSAYIASPSGSASGSTAGRLLAAAAVDPNIPPECIVTKSVRGLPDYWASDIITFGLTIIFLRGGLEIDLELVKKAGSAALRLTVMPGVCEALAVASFSTVIFGMPFILGLSLGFILAAVSPAVVVGAMFDLKKEGYGVKQNIPVLVVAAASFDDVVAISGFAICIAFAIPSATTTTATVLHAVHGPITLLLGLGLGVAGGNICAMTKLWDKPWKRTALVLGLGLFLSFGAKRVEAAWTIDGAHPIAASTGILGALSMAGVTAAMWERGKGYYSSGADKNHAHDVEEQLAELWALVAQPLLFGVVGSFLDFRKMDGETFGKAIGVVLLGVCFRTIMAFFATMRTKLTVKERIFVALSWLPKATVQAAFASYPLTKILEKSAAGTWDSPEQQVNYEKWGNDVLTAGVLAILLTAPTGLLLIKNLGPRWLQQDTDSSMVNSINEMVTAERAKTVRRLGAVVESGSQPSSPQIIKSNQVAPE